MSGMRLKKWWTKLHRVLIENAFGRVKTIWKRMRGPIAISKLKFVHQEWPIIFFLALDLQAPLR